MVPIYKGGHSIKAALSGKGWLCSVCRIKAGTWRKLAVTKCGGTETKNGFNKNGSHGENGDAAGRTRWMVTSGMVQWCRTCGCFAESRTTKRTLQTCPDLLPGLVAVGA